MPREGIIAPPRRAVRLDLLRRHLRTLAQPRNRLRGTVCAMSLDEFIGVCGRCGRTTPILVVNWEHQTLNPDEQAAVAEWGQWYQRFNEVEDVYESRCPNCVPENERHLWERVADT
jgi:hypothetical protein